MTSGPKPRERVRLVHAAQAVAAGTRSPYRTPSKRARFDDASAGAMM